MARLSELLEFKKENFFDGAVQSDWFYNKDMNKKVSESYIFHGPRYYGLDQSDVNKSKHKLIDTATFVKTIFNKLYLDNDSSRFMLTIAGYGAGKSHLSVALASLLSGLDKSLQSEIIDKLIDVDSEIGQFIKDKASEENLVLVINGMNDFNLNNEILKNAKRALALHGIEEDIFKDMSVAFEIAEKFLLNTFEQFSEIYMNVASNKAKFKRLDNASLKNQLLHGLRDDEDAYEVINEVYKQMTGNFINWEEGISAGTILTRLHKIFVEERKLFKSVIVVFDEFGRYLEYAAAYPNRAGDAALQQIFEAVQNCKPTMLFVGFIQSDLSAYLARVNNPNIQRYVGRYENSDKFYLSSNLETILANVIKKNGESSEKIISNIFNNRLKSYSFRLFENMKRWIPDNRDKSVWQNEELYTKTIVNGCYPIHPLTVSFLSILSTWMQQRSTLSFLGDIFDSYSSKEISEEGVPYIYPTKVIDSALFNELLVAEDRGRQQGQQCTTFNEIMSKYEERLDEKDKEVLRAILVASIFKVKVFDKADNFSVLGYMTGIFDEDIKVIVRKLENSLGIIYFDETLLRYSFNGESNSKIDFNKEFSKKKITVQRTGYLDVIDDKIKKDLSFDTVQETSFGIINKITTNEWKFNKRLIHIRDFDEHFIMGLYRQLKDANHPDIPKGNIVFLYCDKESHNYVNNVKELFIKNELNKMPVILYLLNDEEEEIKESLIDIRVLKSFSRDDFSKFEKYIKEKYTQCSKIITRKYMELARMRQVINENGVEVENDKIANICMKGFMNLYTKTIPFTFDGFEKKVTPGVVKRYNQVAIALINGTMTKESEFMALEPDLKNRIKSVFNVNGECSWKVWQNNYILTEPAHLTVRQAYDEIMNNIKSKDIVTVQSLVQEYMNPPYGMNVYSLALFVVYIIVLNSKNLEITNQGNKVKLNSLVNLFADEKKETFKEIFKLKLAYKENCDGNAVVNFLQECNSNTSIEKCSELLEKAKRIRSEEDLTEEQEGMLVSNEMILENSVLKCENLYKILDTAEAYYTQYLCKIYNPLGILQVFKDIANVSEGKIDGTNFYYSGEYLGKVNNLKAKAIDKFTAGFDSYINRGINLSELEKFKGFVVRIKKILKDNSKPEEADRIERLTLQVYESAKEKAKYDSVVQKFNSEMDKANSFIQKYDNLKQATEVLEEWKSYIDKQEIPDAIRLSFVKRIEEEEHLIEIKVKELEKSINETISGVENTKNVSELKYFKRKCEEHINKGVGEESKDVLQNIITLIDSILIETDAFNEIKVSLNDLSKEADKFMSKYENTELSNIAKLLSDNKITSEKNKEKIWVEKHIKSKDQLSDMSVSQLVAWQRDVEYIPYYLNNDSIKEVADMKGYVESLLSDYKMENILQLFKDLTDEEKVNCIDKLRGFIDQ